MKPFDLFLRPLLGAVYVAVILLAASPSAHAQAGMFTSLAGEWSGSGTIMVADGGSERIRCRASYKVDASGASMDQVLRCASDSYKFELTSSVRSSGGNIYGDWNEASRNINGTIEGRGSNGSFEALVQANGFAASLSLRASGNRQNIVILSKNTDLRGVNINLTRGS